MQISRQNFFKLCTHKHKTKGSDTFRLFEPKYTIITGFIHISNLGPRLYNKLTSGKCSYRSIKKINMFKVKTLIEKVATRYLKQVP